MTSCIQQNTATNTTSCLPYSTVQQLFVAMHITMAMSCHHEAVSDPDPHMPTGPCPAPASACPQGDAWCSGLGLPSCPWLPAPDCQSHGVSLQSPGSSQPSLHHGSFEPFLRISGFFATPSPVLPCTQVPAMCFLLPHFQLLPLEHALLPPASFTVHHPSLSPALILVPFLPSFLLYGLPPPLCLPKSCNVHALWPNHLHHH